jgi:glyoxylase-like metal-dependent hydrolase (beta-lactamase superfamily II)
MIVERVVVSHLRSNCFIVGMDSSSEGMVIDPGGDVRDILARLKQVKFTIKLIVLTHGHSDHVGALYEVQQATGAGAAIHSEDSYAVSGSGSTTSMFGVTYRTSLTPVHILRDGDAIDVGDLHFTVVHTPGHTQGSICLVGHHAVFTGDTLFYHGIGTTYTYNSNRSDLIDSINKHLMSLPDDTIIYPGHGRNTTVGTERRENRYLTGRGRDRRYW